MNGIKRRNGGRMKASIYYGKGDIRYEETAVPEIGDGEILMRMEA